MYRRSIAIGGEGGPPLSKNIVFGFTAILGISLPQRYFVLEFEWTNPAVQNSLLRPLDQEKNYLFTYSNYQLFELPDMKCSYDEL